MLFKYVVKNTARAHGKSATFMPKPLYGDNGSGMHCHQSLWKDGNPLFSGDQYAGLSEMAKFYIGGLLKHVHARDRRCDNRRLDTQAHAFEVSATAVSDGTSAVPIAQP